MSIYRLSATLLLAAACWVGVAQTSQNAAPSKSANDSKPAITSIHEVGAPRDEAGAPQNPPSRDDVLRMFDAMHLRKQMDQLMAMMTTQVKQQMHGTVMKTSNLSAADQAKIDARLGDAMTIYPIPEMLDDMIPVYQRHISKSDVEAIIAFYGSPAGQHLLTESPVMMQESMSVIMPKMNTRMQAYMEKVTKDIQNMSPGPGAAAQPSKAPQSTPAPK